MAYFQLAPAYGRDYKTAREVKEAFARGNDFEGDYSLNFQLVNKEQLPKGSVVNLRFSGLRKIAQVRI